MLPHRVFPQLFAPQPCLVSPTCLSLRSVSFLPRCSQSDVCPLSSLLAPASFTWSSSDLPCCGGRYSPQKVLDKSLKVKCCPVLSSAFWGSEYSTEAGRNEPKTLQEPSDYCTGILYSLFVCLFFKPALKKSHKFGDLNSKQPSFDTARGHESKPGCSELWQAGFSGQLLSFFAWNFTLPVPEHHFIHKWERMPLLWGKLDLNPHCIADWPFNIYRAGRTACG